MSELFSQLGVNFKLLAAQAINFLIVLTILRLTVYKPLLGLLESRRSKIQKGIEDSELAKKELEASEKIKAEKIAEAEKESLSILSAMQTKTKILEEKLLDEARKKGEELVRITEARGEEEISKEKAKFYSEALDFVKLAVVRTVELSPNAIDDKLIDQAISSLSKSKAK